MGTQSFRKGSVQTVLPLTNGGSKAAIKITTALYYTPNRRSIQAEGIVPDIVVHPSKVEAQEERRVSEASLSGHLENATTSSEEHASDNFEDEANTRRIAERLALDFQLKEAVNVLRGLSILSEVQ